ncbi:hypothetical protein JCM8547_000292 [Rhodosporidiobolus lusitaniae]
MDETDPRLRPSSELNLVDLSSSSTTSPYPFLASPHLSSSSSSSPSSSTSSSSIIFSASPGHLPVELVRQILHFAAPLDYSPTLYRERRALLRSCCRVSKLIRDVAQPMLPEVYALSRSIGPNELGVVEEERTRGSRVMVLVFRRHVQPFAVDFDLGWLNGLSKLRRLLIDDSIVALDPSTQLRSLLKLSLFSCLNPPSLRQVVSKNTTPSLRHLTVMDVTATREEMADFFSSLPSSDRIDSTLLILDAELLPAKSGGPYPMLQPPTFYDHLVFNCLPLLSRLPVALPNFHRVSLGGAVLNEM